METQGKVRPRSSTASKATSRCCSSVPRRAPSTFHATLTARCTGGPVAAGGDGRRRLIRVELDVEATEAARQRIQDKLARLRRGDHLN